MSHIPQRKEKDCLNCGATVQGRYCHVCGQENVEPKETFWHIVTHFFYDITHFDSNFFTTVKDLLFKPGFLSKEYMMGRRVSYLHPIRMYVFTSAIFFLLFFSFFNIQKAITINTDSPVSSLERASYINKLQEKLKKDPGNAVLKEKLNSAKNTFHVITQNDTYDEEEGVIQFSDKNYKSIAEYDSIEQALPAAERDGWLTRKIIKKQIEVNNKYRHNPGEADNKLIEIFFHQLPYMLFVSLPLFALILKLVYIRRKQFYFADHGVFTIHLYVFSFILLIVVFGLNNLQSVTHWEFLNIIQGFLFLGLFCYLYISMHRFYKQGWFKTFLKFLIVAILSVIMMLILFVIFLLFSAFNI